MNSEKAVQDVFQCHYVHLLFLPHRIVLWNVLFSDLLFIGLLRHTVLRWLSLWTHLWHHAKTIYLDNSKSYLTNSRNASLCLLQHLSFPTCRGDAARFNFSLSSNQDIEGPQGSFECIQQTSSRSVPFLSTWLGLKMWKKSKRISYCCSLLRKVYIYKFFVFF